MIWFIINVVVFCQYLTIQGGKTMIKASKRLISILICLTLVLTMLSMAVFAEGTTYYLRGSMNNWGANAGNAMTDNGDGTYSITMELAAGSYEFKGAVADWSWSCPSGSNAKITLDDANTVTFILDPSANTLTYTLASGEVKIDYYLRGDMNGWTAGDDNKMTDNGDGTYSITMELAAGTYGYKAAVADWTWSCPSGDNASITLDKDGSVTFTLDLAANTVTAVGAGIGEPDPVVVDYITVVGAGPGGFLDWDPANESNRMGIEYTGHYRVEYYNVPAGAYEFKFAANGAWDNDWGTGGVVQNGVECDVIHKGANGTFVVEEDGSDVMIYLDMSNMDATGKGAKVTVWITPPDTEDASADIKFQTKDNSLRLVTWVDSLDYSEVTFNVTIGGETANIPCTAVYSAINAGGLKLDSAAEIFNEDALYFVTYTINNLPAEVTEMDVSVTWTDLDGNTETSGTRTITL
jgi:hypothetical protein